jgi:hemerythrin-like metal-binding protein
MKRLEWIPQLALHVEPIDSQHQFLFELYNKACASVGTGDAAGNQEALLHELFAYADYHFATEEGLMASIHYPEAGLKDHTRKHREFLERLEALQGQPMWELLDYVHEWLLRHVMTEDFKIKAFIKS